MKRGGTGGRAFSDAAGRAAPAALIALIGLALAVGCSRRAETGAGADSSLSSPSEEVSSSLPFAPLSFDEALARARAENKLVLVDVYTDWCGWCTKMDRDVFANDRVKTALLAFVPIRVNAEKGDGRNVAARYRVYGLPTFLVVDADGTVVRRFEGYLPVDVFLAKLGPPSGVRG